jgi:Ca2+-transporting ATPase
MPGKVIQVRDIRGLSQQQVIILQQQFGKNILHAARENRFLRLLWDVVREPMFLLLVIACSLYFILGDVSEGIMMLVTMIIVATISVYQEVKSSRALDALRQFTEPRVTVIRDGEETVVSVEDLVPGDIVLLEEGMKVPADGRILQGNDFSVNESLITGESLPVEKNNNEGSNQLYQGTTVESGKCIGEVTAIGNNTVLGKIGRAVAGYSYPKTLLQVQINRFVRRLALFGLLGFAIILLVNFQHYRDFTTSLLFALTLAMSAVPEEIPVAFSSFMALGAYKMSKHGIISRQPMVIENLGAVTVLCLDKTGTITENRMQVKSVYDYSRDRLVDLGAGEKPADEKLLLYAALASESNPFDSMEKAIFEAYEESCDDKTYAGHTMIYEYPLEGRPPMMTHVYAYEGGRVVVAAKGAAERILRVCKLDDRSFQMVIGHVKEMARNGYRVLGVAGASHSEQTYPGSQDEFNWSFLGLVALYDPPKKNAAAVLQQIRKAGVDIKLLTGDYAETAINIASQVGIDNHHSALDGTQVMQMTESELKSIVQEIPVFTRMFPDAKLKVINALRANGEIVAMTGDGINDAPALKSADIGIAMGKKGTETARRAADLILTDDNLDKMVSAISEGRKIFSNLVKGIRYIISIHIPIILTASLPLVLGWTYPNIFTPIHVIFLELIMGPTCSIFFENEPVETNVMESPPRSRKSGLFTREELLIGIVQGLTITAGVLILYYIFMKEHHSIEETRSVVFTTLIISNVFLTFAARSMTRTLYYTLRYRNNLAAVILVASIVFLVALHSIPGLRNLFQLAPITGPELLLCAGVAFASVMWFELYKMDLWKPRN